MKNCRTNIQLEKTSKIISLIRRNHPDGIGITLNEHGWTNVQEMIDRIKRSGGH